MAKQQKKNRLDVYLQFFKQADDEDAKDYNKRWELGLWLRHWAKSSIISTVIGKGSPRPKKTQKFQPNVKVMLTVPFGFNRIVPF